MTWVERHDTITDETTGHTIHALDTRHWLDEDGEPTSVHEVRTTRGWRPYEPWGVIHTHELPVVG